MKLSFNLSAPVVDELKRLAEKRGCTMTEVLRQGIGKLAYFDEVRTAGGRVLIANKYGALSEIVFP